MENQIRPNYDWQKKMTMDEIPKWYLNLSSTTEGEVEKILSLTRQEWNNYLTVALDPPFNEDDYLKHEWTPKEPWGYLPEDTSRHHTANVAERINLSVENHTKSIEDKPRKNVDDNVFDLMDRSSDVWKVDFKEWLKERE